MKSLEEYAQQLRGILSPERYQHSVAVMEQSIYLAEQWGADVEKAAYIGLLHDVCKEKPNEWQLQYLLAHGILLDNYERKNPGIWHGPVGALFLEHEWRIIDREILDAVYYHVLGRANMTLLEQVILVADYTSADRDFHNARAVRALLPAQRLEAIFQILKRVTECNLNRGKFLLPQAVESYNFYASQRYQTQQ